MKRVIAVVVMVLFIVGAVSVAIAQEAEPETDTSLMKQEQGKMDMGNMKSMMMRHKKDKDSGKMSMLKSTMQSQIVSTNDGGVIVLSGNKLLKYDKNLELQKEVEIPVDMDAMHKKMMQMMKDCPMKDKMQGEDEEDEMEEEAQE